MEDEFDTVDMSNMIGQSVAQFHYAANQVNHLNQLDRRHSEIREKRDKSNASVENEPKIIRDQH